MVEMFSPRRDDDVLLAVAQLDRAVRMHHAPVATVVDELPQHVLQMPTPEDRYVGGAPPRSLPVTHRRATASGLIGSTAEPTLPAQRCWLSSMSLLRLLIDLLILRGRLTPDRDIELLVLRQEDPNDDLSHRAHQT
jgi:hypothetical protein